MFQGLWQFPARTVLDLAILLAAVRPKDAVAAEESAAQALNLAAAQQSPSAKCGPSIQCFLADAQTIGGRAPIHFPRLHVIIKSDQLQGSMSPCSP